MADTSPILAPLAMKIAGDSGSRVASVLDLIDTVGRLTEDEAKVLLVAAVSSLVGAIEEMETLTVKAAKLEILLQVSADAAVVAAREDRTS